MKAIASATSLTLITPYGGPTATGNSWTAVPNATLVGITAQVAADVAKAIRGLNLDKENWQQVFSGTGTITVTLSDGSTYIGPSWSSITTSLAGKAEKGANSDITSLSGLTQAITVNQGGTGSTSASAARTALGVAYGTTAGTVARGDDTRLSTISGKSGGNITGDVIAVRYDTTYGVGPTVSSIVFPTGASVPSVQWQSFAEVNANGRYGHMRLWQDSGYRDWYYEYSTGNAYSPGSWVNNSDERIKDQVARISNPLDRMRKIKGCTWVRKDDQMKGAIGIGLVAQDVLAAFSDIPEVVSHSRQGSLTVDGVEVENPLAISPGDVSSALHHEAILVLMDKIEALESKLAEIQAS